MPAEAQVWCPWIHMADDSQRRYPWRSGPRVTTHWLAVVSLGGREVIEVAGRIYDIASGGGYLIQPGARTVLGSPAGNRPQWLHFDLAYDPRRAEHPQVHGYAPTLGPRSAWMQPDATAMLGCDLPVEVPAAALPRFRAGVQAAVTLWKTGDVLARHQAAGELSLAVLAVAAAGAPAPRRDNEGRIALAEEAARASLGSGASLAAMAATAGLGRSRFCELYQRLRGTSPGTFLRAERLRCARELLAHPELSVAEVARQVGCADATVFGRFFRAATGMTPGAWRAQPVPSPRRTP